MRRRRWVVPCTALFLLSVMVLSLETSLVTATTTRRRRRTASSSSSCRSSPGHVRRRGGGGDQSSSSSMAFLSHCVVPSSHPLHAAPLAPLAATAGGANDGNASPRRVVIIGGGPAGFMGAIEAGQITSSTHPPTQVLLLEGSQQLLHKVSISGGGRCNVMHDARKPVKDIVQGYPRGQRELLGPYTSVFGPKEIMAWFTSRGVTLKVENDGRVFPTTDSSQTIIDCLRAAATKAGVEVRTGWKARSITPSPPPPSDDSSSQKEVGGGGGGRITITLDAPAQTPKKTENKPSKTSMTLTCDALLLATGSSRDGHALAASLGHTIIDPVPSLFTLELAEKKSQSPSPLVGLAGISVDLAEVTLLGLPLLDEKDKKEGGGEGNGKGKGWKDILKEAGLRGAAGTASLTQRGPLLITHTGFSGPAILRLSAFAARVLHACGYKARIRVDWVPDIEKEEVLEKLTRAKVAHAKKAVATFCPLLSTTPQGDLIGEPRLPRRLWARLVHKALGGGGKEEEVEEEGRGETWGSLSPKALLALTEEIKGSVYTTTGKGTFKEEFTTAGGVSLKEIDFRTFESKKVPDVYFAGEVLDCDGVTGGYNFMSCWTGGYIAGRSMAQRILEQEGDA